MEEDFISMDELYEMTQWPELYKRRREDNISKLPDSLVCQILVHLPTKDIVRTCVLSKRWKTVWLLIPELDLDANDFPNHNAFVVFTDRFLDFSMEHKSCLDKLKLSVPKDKYVPPCVTRWVDFVAKSKLKHLNVECVSANRNFLEVIPSSFYMCETLVYLRLHRVRLGEFESVSFPCLKTMRLEENVYVNDAVLESFISSCLVLEDLIIVRMVQDNVKVLRVHSRTLTRLDVDLRFGEGDDYDDDFEKKGSGVLIDAPRLQYLKFQDDLSDSKLLSNCGSLAKISLVYIFPDVAEQVDLPKQNIVRNFFNSISGVKDMTISMHTMEFLFHNLDFDPLPQFCNLSHLKVKIYIYTLEILPKLLESCPNLKSLVLVLDFDPFKEKVDVRLSSVPQCLLSSLEVVELKHFNGGPAKMEVARYILGNSVVLKKLVLHLRCSSIRDGFNILRDLHALPRRSSTCQVVIC